MAVAFKDQDIKLSLAEHLDELRSRVVKSVIFIIITSGIFYNLVNLVLPHLVSPVGKLVFIGPQEAFITNIKIALFGGLFLASPFVIYQIWEFISVGLSRSERKYSLIFGPTSFVCFSLGVSFGYFIIVPIAVKFLLGFSSEFIVPMITASKYISFIGALCLAFGVVFQLPLVSLFLTKIGVVTPEFLSSKRKHALVLIFVLSATLTPPDVVTQVLMAVPLALLYELGIIFSKIAYGKDK